MSIIKRCFFLSLLMLVASPLMAQNLPVYTATNSTITVDSNHSAFIIRLKSNPTTGYSWFVQSYPKNFFTVTPRSYVRPEKNLMGAGGYQEWLVKTHLKNWQSAQPVKLVIVYKRPWEKAIGQKAVFNVKRNAQAQSMNFAPRYS